VFAFARLFIVSVTLVCKSAACSLGGNPALGTMGPSTKAVIFGFFAESLFLKGDCQSESRYPVLHGKTERGSVYRADKGTIRPKMRFGEEGNATALRDPLVYGGAKFSHPLYPVGDG